MTRVSPAKVNLHLKILGGRPDGFHEIETLMVPVTLADEIHINVVDEPGIVLRCENPQVPTGAENLIGRAAELFFEETGTSLGLHIHLLKKIPMGAGLGGGSSNAATVLVALNDLAGSRLSVADLENLAARIGSDVAWFIRGEAAICRGRGEIIGGKVEVPCWPLLLLKPPFGVSTPWAYQAWAKLLNQESITQVVDGIPLNNDLEPPVFHKYVLLPAIKSWLLAQDGVRAGAMSGSGSTMFAVLESAALADSLSREARAVFGETLWVHRCEISPSPPPDLPDGGDSGFFR
ncbi:MAG: 4-(cytidine 5'-diphospho)-2-C-methyl-D-erythritol kinase [Terrimicrobiaceae bacterium]